MKVCELERSLFESFPKVDAESWDHVGLSVGDPDSTVGRVLVALDATADMVRRAHDGGANVLLAHHPVYIAAPDAFVPRSGSHPQAAAAVFEAARLGVS
ncbi:Nif3-like dinuclear metal center hexameric protein, partial [Enorma massiliensis]